MHIFQLGYPGNLGGANTECWHTVKLWRKAGWDVTMIPTWGPDESMQPKLEAIGVNTVVVDRVPPYGCQGLRPKLEDVPDLAGGIVVGMCNSHVCGCWEELRSLGCKIIWINCMTYIEEHEHQAFVNYGPADAYLFQSEFQRSQLEPRLRKYGYETEQGFTIHGAFDLDEWEFKPKPHPPKGAFTVGRLSRPYPGKWSKNHWQILGGIPYAERRALCMAWDDQLDQHCGRPPSWAECLPKQSISAQQFMAHCHCLLHVNGTDRENWPRVGLEAMAAGVPVIAQNKWGWREMIKHGHSGFLCDDEAEMCYYAALLAHDEPLRIEMAEQAYARLGILSSSATLISQWRKMLEYVSLLGPWVRPKLNI
jgi:glycosyltransferase involved in cell wall biosynthesis